VSDFARYSRQVILREVGVNGQAVLRDSSVLVIGLGGLGSAAALYLAGAGIGRLVLSDLDRVDRSNLQRQILYRSADVGRAKLDAAADSLRALNPECELELRPGPLDDASLLAVVRAVDLVLDCSDNFITRFAVNAACVAARKPLVSGAAIRFEGQLALFDTRRGGACYACLYGESGEVQETCEQALSAIKHLLGIGDDAGTLMIWDALKPAWRTLTINRDPNCRVCAASRAE
jgi:molybdopterin/thiamine biosynthesis adenylyltransferase